MQKNQKIILLNTHFFIELISLKCDFQWRSRERLTGFLTIKKLKTSVLVGFRFISVKRYLLTTEVKN